MNFATETLSKQLYSMNIAERKEPERPPEQFPVFRERGIEK